MKEKPILMSTPMVKAILDGRKTQTRRIIKHKNIIEDVRPVMRCVENENDWEKYILTDEFGEDFLIKPKCEVGDILWVREAYAEIEDSSVGFLEYLYRADCTFEYAESVKWKPSIFMPKDACRIKLKVTDIRVERLDDISKDDAIAEGIYSWTQQGCTRYKSYIEPMVGFWDTHRSVGCHSAIASYRSLWASINGFDSLNSNPWVWAITFKRIENDYTLT